MKRHREMYDRCEQLGGSRYDMDRVYICIALICWFLFFLLIFHFFFVLQKIKKDGEGWRVEMVCLCQGVSRRSRNRQPSVSTNPIGQSDGPSFSRLGIFKGLEEIGTGHERDDLFFFLRLAYIKETHKFPKEKRKKKDQGIRHKVSSPKVDLSSRWAINGNEHRKKTNPRSICAGRAFRHTLFLCLFWAALIIINSLVA